MTNMRTAVLASGILMTFIAAGCGLKPSPNVPSDLTAKRALESIRRHADAVSDLSGWGRAKSVEGNSVRTAKVSVKYLRPNLFKSVILGFAGIEIATVASDGDSLTAYIPSADGFIRTGLDAEALSAILPLAGAVLNDLIPIMAGSPPLPEAPDTDKTEVRHRGRNAEIIVKNGETEYFYLLAGPDLRVVECRNTFHGDPVWTVKWDRFEKNGDIYFPRSVTVILDRGKVGFEWSSYTLNTGLSRTACALSIPPDAKRLFPRPARK